MADVFSPMISNLQELGIYLYLFPFLISLAFTYGILSYALKDQLEKTARGLISILVSFFVMLFSMWNPGIVEFFANIFGYMLILGTGFLAMVILLAFMGIKPSDVVKNEKAKWTFIATVAFIVLITFVAAVGSVLFGSAAYLQSSQFWTIILFIVIIAVVMWSMSKGG